MPNGTPPPTDLLTPTLRLLNRGGNLADRLRAAISALRAALAIDAISLRLIAMPDAPFFFAEGYPAPFLATENSLAGGDPANGPDPCRECLCGAVLDGRIEAGALPYTSGGSFHTGQLARLAAGSPVKLRTACLRAGFASLALIPVRNDDAIRGVLHLADRRPDRFDAALVERLEGVAEAIGLCIGQFDREAHTRQVEHSYAELRRTEAEVRKLSLVVEQSPIIVVITGPDGRIEYVNPRFTEVTGYTREEAIGSTPAVLKSGETDPEVYRSLWSTIRRGENWRGEFLNRKKNGDLFREEATVFPLRDGAGAITHFIAVKEDVTERRAFREAMIHRERMAAIGDLAASVAHELNNPIGIIYGYADHLCAKADVDPRTRERLGLIFGQAERCKRIVTGLLEYSRKREFKPEAVDAGAILRRAFDLVAARLRETGIAWRIEAGPGTPRALGEPFSLQQVFVNLAVNALESMAGGGEIVARVEAAGDGVRITFSDDGPGVPEAARARIFEPYFTTKATGTGLGLAISARILENMQGRIELNPAAPGGEFVITLPAAR